MEGFSYGEFETSVQLTSVSNYDQRIEVKEMAELSLHSTTEKQSTEFELPTTVSTPLQPIKRKNDDTVSNGKLHKKPRKKMYRPKVIGEGKRRKRKVSATPEIANNDPKTPSPVTPSPHSSKQRTKKKNSANIHKANGTVNASETGDNGRIFISCRRDLNFYENEYLESEQGSTVGIVPYQIQSEIQMPENGIPSYRDSVGIESEKSMEMEENPDTTVNQIHNESNSFRVCDGYFSGLEIPKEFKRKRTARKRKMNKFNNLKGRIPLLENYSSSGSEIRKVKLRIKIGERKVQESGNKLRRKRGNGKDMSDKQLFLIVKRKRSPMVRRCNLVALHAFPFPFCNKYARKCVNNTIESEKTENFWGNCNGGRMAHSSKFNCCSRDDCKGRKTNKFSGSPSDLEYNGRCEAVKNPITDANTVGKLTKRLAQMTLAPASYKFQNLQSAGTLWKIEDLPRTEKLSNNRGQLTMQWLDMRHFLRNSKFFNARNEKNPQKRDFSLTRITTGSANETRSLQSMILWNRNQGTLNYHEHIKLAGEPRGTNCSSGLLSNDSQKEGIDLSKEKQIIPYASDERNQTLQLKHNASSAQRRQGIIVPYQRPINSTKKRELDRVYLDPRNITMWELVVKSEGNFGKEQIDANTAKWWENERQVFRGRIDAFIARMHPILGDRRFSQWKSSVVDSVVGVFLTQNVSDHHSSSAFMSLAAAFPLPFVRNPTENYEGQEFVFIQESTATNKESFECESKWNGESKMEKSEKTVEECMSPKKATASLDFLTSSIKQSTDGTQFFSSTFSEEDRRTCVSLNLQTTSDTTLLANRSTFVQGISSVQSSKLSCESNRVNKLLESNEMDYRNQKPSSESINHKDATSMHRSSCKSYLHPECNSQTKSVLEMNAEGYNCCQGTSGVDFWLKPGEESQKLVDSIGKVQSQESQATHDANDKCYLSVDCSTQTKNGIEETTENCHSHQGKTAVGPQLSPYNELSEKLVDDDETVQSREKKVQAPDKANGGKKNGKKEKHQQDLDNGKQTEIPIRHTKKTKEKQAIDWDSLQKKWDTMRTTYSNCEPRSSNRMDFVNWEAVRYAEPSKIAEAIKERGQHNIIAARIKEFLDRVIRLHGSIDLEWLRSAPPDDVKEYLLGINGIGLKSVECIRLLELQQVAFPVDINVGRIAVRLGWVPLEPLPEEVQMHLLETFPMMDSIQKYLWPRLCTLDQRTLYELHYQLITFGKVFCTKRKPNCNACPLRGECRHYSSAFASAKLMLPGPTEKTTVGSVVPYKAPEGTVQVMNPALMLHMEDNPSMGSRYRTDNYEPIVEEPPSPEPEYAEYPLTDIEDLCEYEYDSDDIPTIRLNSGQLTTSQKYLDDENEMLQETNITRALVPFNTKAAYIPMRKLKHVDRLRTEHQVYELPDTHPLLLKLEAREPSDPCPYLLCILTPGENVNLSEPPCTQCTYQESGELCREGACSSCNIIKEQNNGTIRGTILIPCRTAMRGVFPLNGTYFQVNEVFADDATSKEPIHVPRRWIWSLPRRTAYFGTSTTTIFRGLAREKIQYCFQRGFICVRGFDRDTRTPKRLVERLHRATSVAGKSKAANKKEE